MTVSLRLEREGWQRTRLEIENPDGCCAIRGFTGVPDFESATCTLMGAARIYNVYHTACSSVTHASVACYDSS